MYREYLSQPYLKDNAETEFCKEANILARFDEILSSRKIFVSPFKKKLQRFLYHPNKLKARIAKNMRIFKVYGKKAIERITRP